MSSLTKQQQTTVIYLAGTVLALLLSGYLVYSLNAEKTAVAKLNQEVQNKETQTRNTQRITNGEQSQWSAEEAQINGLLVADQSVPQVFEEITKLAAESGIQQRLALNTDEATVQDEKLTALGIHRYLAVTMKFQGQYADVAKFIGSLAKLGRAVEYRSINFKRGVPLIEVQVVLNIYKREAA